MRKTLLATVALVGVGTTFAQAQVTPNPSQGQYIGPYGTGPAGNNNNNAWGIANTPSGSQAAGPLSTMFAPDTVAVPKPGTIVIRLNGRVEVDLTANFTSADVGVNANGTPNGYKLNPVGIGSYMRLYPGFDGVSSNGLRYGAAIELRTNFGAADRTFASPTSGPANSPSTNSSAQTVFVRRAFGYVASNQAGLLRLGQADGVLGLFDNCIFTSQCWDAGITGMNGGALQATTPTGPTNIPFAWLTASGAEYGNSKIVYLSPQIFGFDVGAQYAPNMGNIFQDGGLGVGCGQAGPTCINVSSGNDPTRWLNQVGVGLRYQHNFGAVDVKTYGFYEAAGKEQLTTAAYVAPSPTASAQALRYDNLSFYKAGIAVTAFNITAAIDYIGGAVNNGLQMRPTGGVSTNAVLPGLTYANGPLTMGLQVGIVNSQGAAQLTGLSQRHEFEVATGGTYKVAPGMQVVAEYMYTQRHQGGFNFSTNAVGPTRDGKGQGIMLSTVFTW